MRCVLKLQNEIFIQTEKNISPIEMSNRKMLHLIMFFFYFRKFCSTLVMLSHYSTSKEDEQKWAGNWRQSRRRYKGEEWK